MQKQDLIPVIFDFKTPENKDVTGTVETLARLARFIIADITDLSSIPHELATIVPFLRTTPILPIKLKSSQGYSMFDDFKIYPWVLTTYKYENEQSLIASLTDILKPVEAKLKDLRLEFTSVETR